MAVQSEHRERILKHAKDRFFREGFSRISVDELTGDLSMSKKTFYQAFESKDDLIEQVVQRQLGEINSSMEHILAQPDDSIVKLHNIVRYMGNMISSISMATMADMQRHAPHLWNRIEEFRRERLTKNITQLVQQGMSEGSVRKDVNSRVFLLAYLTSIQTIMQSTVLSNESFSSKEALEAIMDIFFKGILTGSARSRLEELQYIESTHSR